MCYPVSLAPEGLGWGGLPGLCGSRDVRCPEPKCGQSRADRDGPPIWVRASVSPSVRGRGLDPACACPERCQLLSRRFLPRGGESAQSVGSLVPSLGLKATSWCSRCGFSSAAWLSGMRDPPRFPLQLCGVDTPVLAAGPARGQK